MQAIYSGRMLVAPRAASTATEAGRTVAVPRYDVTLPAQTPAKVGDLLALTTALTDPTWPTSGSP